MGRASDSKNGLQKPPERLVVGLSGASGVAYGIRLLEALRELRIESHLVMTKPAQMTIAYETDMTPKQVAAKADHHHGIEDIGASIASGSFTINNGGGGNRIVRVACGSARPCESVAHCHSVMPSGSKSSLRAISTRDFPVFLHSRSASIAVLPPL